MANNSIIYFCLAVFLSNVMASVAARRFPWGHSCTSDSDCQDSLDDQVRYMILREADKNSECLDGRCNCKKPLQRRIFDEGNYKCTPKYIFESDIGKCSQEDSTSCIGGSCKKEEWDHYSYCICNKGSVLVGNTCREIKEASLSDSCIYPESGLVPVCNHEKNMYCDPSKKKCTCFKNLYGERENGTCISAKEYFEIYYNETLVALNEFCGTTKVDSLPKNCDEEANMTCQNSACKCKREFYPVESNGTCESKQSYAKEHNLTRYKVKPGVYCDYNYDCITGLDCFENKCACPYPCVFVSITETCDCGEVSALEGAGRAILVGVLGGFVIIFFWWRMIKKTMNKRQKKPRFRNGYEDAPSEPLTHPASEPTPNSANAARAYHLNQVTVPLTINKTDTPLPSSAFTPDNSTSISSTTNPVVDSSYPLNPYPFNPSHSTVPDFSSPPEMYSSTIPASAPTIPPTETTQPPPYSSPPPAYDDIYKPVIS